MSAFDFVSHKRVWTETGTSDNASFTTTFTNAPREDGKGLVVTFVPVFADIAMTALKLQGSNDGTTAVDVTEGNFAAAEGPYDIALPSATDDNKAWMWNITLPKFKYYRVTGTAGNGSTGVQWVVTFDTFNIGEGPRTDAQYGGTTGSIRFPTGNNT